METTGRLASDAPSRSMMNPAKPLSRSASHSHRSRFPSTRRFVGAGGGVVSGRFVSLTYRIHARAIAAPGGQPALRGSPENSEAGRASEPVGGASQTSPEGMAFGG